MSYIDCSTEENRIRVNQIISRLKQGVDLATELEISNLLYNEAYVALMIANTLGHKFNIETQGESGDALDAEDNPVEYKFITKKGDNYSGCSFQFHWLSAEKIARYQLCSHFYFAWRDGFVIEKIVCIERDILMPEIIAKAGADGSTAGHKSFGHARIDKLVVDGYATIVYP